jgi:hypothetical protein
MRRWRTGLIAVLGLGFAALGGAASAADSIPSNDNFATRFEIAVTPYGWMAGLNGTIRFRPDCRSSTSMNRSARSWVSWTPSFRCVSPCGTTI